MHLAGRSTHRVGRAKHLAGPSMHKVGRSKHSAAPSTQKVGRSIHLAGRSMHKVGPSKHSNGLSVDSVARQPLQVAGSDFLKSAKLFCFNRSHHFNRFSTQNFFSSNLQSVIKITTYFVPFGSECFRFCAQFSLEQPRLAVLSLCCQKTFFHLKTKTS